MRFSFKSTIIATLAALTMASTPAVADTVRIAVGQEGRGYEAFGKDIAARLKNMETEIDNYEGSDDISRAVCDGEAEIGIMQIDAIYTRAKEGCKMRVVGTYGTEYAYLLSPPNSDVNELHDMDGSSKILVDTVGSGTDLFWHTIVAIETGEEGNESTWSNATPINDPIFIAETLAEMKEIDAALMVTVPNSAELRALIDAGWSLAELDDKDINDELFNDASLYPRETAEVAGTGGFLSGNKSNDSYAVRSFVVISDSLMRDRRAFADIARAVKTVSKARGN